MEDEEEDEVETLGREVKRLKLNSEFGLLERKAAWPGFSFLAMWD